MHLKAWIMKDLHILKHSFKGPSVLFHSNVCLKKSCLLHTGDNAPASDFFFGGGGGIFFYYFPHMTTRARASGDFFGIYVYIFQQFLYTGQQTLLKAWKKRGLCIITCFSEGSQRPNPLWNSSMCLKKNCFPHTVAKARASNFFGGAYVLFH